MHQMELSFKSTTSELVNENSNQDLFKAASCFDYHYWLFDLKAEKTRCIKMQVCCN